MDKYIGIKKDKKTTYTYVNKIPNILKITSYWFHKVKVVVYIGFIAYIELNIYNNKGTEGKRMVIRSLLL